MIVDRIEGAVAVVEISKGRTRDVPTRLIDGRVRDGAVLVENGDGTYTVDEEETVRRSTHARSRLKGLFE